MDPEEDIDSWIEGLAGRGKGDAKDEGARRALREAVHEEAKLVFAPDTDELARLEQRLEREGLLRPVVAAPAAVATRRPRVHQAVRFLAAASVAGFAVTLGYLYVQQPGPEDIYEVPRGVTSGVKVIAENPGKRADEVERELAALGIEAERSESGERVILEFPVKPEQLDRFIPWYRGLGGYPAGPGTYRVIVAPTSEQVEEVP